MASPTRFHSSKTPLGAAVEAFFADRDLAGLPNIVPAELDRSPDGRGRLSYQRAWSLFREASGGQWTLHQLHHSALTHLGEDGVSAPLLMAKSRHRDLRTLSRYVRPGTKAVAQLTAEHDQARRGKHPRRESCHAQKKT